MWRTISPPAIPCAYRPQAAREIPSRFGPRRRDSGTRTPSSPRRTDVNPLERPGNRRQIASHARKPRRPWPIPCRTPPSLRPETRPGAPWTRRVARRQAASKGATLFRVLRPMRSAREQREKLTSGYFYFHARLRFLPCRRARAACDSRDARHATGAGLRV